MKRILLATAFAVAVMGGATTVLAQSNPMAALWPGGRPAFNADGSVQVPSFNLPASAFLSAEARAFQEGRARGPQFDGGGAINGQMPTIAQRREQVDAQLAPNVASSQARYEVDVAEQTIAGVPTRVFTPRAGVADRRRVLINLHGGGFSVCAYGCAMAESIPIAAVGRFKVISVDYRQGPEHQFPAASEDVAAVYRELLQSYRPENIGIYGCSAGGALSAQVASWFQTHDLPNPGAIGIFGAGGTRMGAGDSAHIAAYIDGSFPPPGPGGRTFPIAYFTGADMNDPLISPAMHPNVMHGFPPTLLITGTRAIDMSPAIYTHSELLKAGVDSQLVVGEGMGHCYIYNPELPESRDAYGIITRFFDQHLGERPRR